VAIQHRVIAAMVRAAEREQQQSTKHRHQEHVPWAQRQLRAGGRRPVVMAPLENQAKAAAEGRVSIPRAMVVAALVEAVAATAGRAGKVAEAPSRCSYSTRQSIWMRYH
jgi:hypothetical protein